ncbi:MAG: thermonuclease family protein [Alphaproteobacteria bacterium]|nr:thermonuclease family protein [Alphaproteobacteria bacterium]
MASAERSFGIALVTAVLLWCSAAQTAYAQAAPETVAGEIRVRGAGVVQVLNQWFQLLGASTFERDEACHLGRVPYQCGLIAQGHLAEISAGTRYTCTLHEFRGDTRRYGDCVSPSGEKLAATWVRSGWAFAHRLHSSALVAEEAAARAAKRGMWAGTTPPVDGAAPASVSGAAYILDANTLRIGGTLVRLAGTDAPETPQSCGLAAGRGPTHAGIFARGMLSNMTMGKRIHCVIERRPGDDRNFGVCGEADAAGTAMRAGTQTLNEQMLAAGWAVADRVHPRADYADLQIKADRDNVGLWQGPFMRPDDWRRGYR